MLRRFWIRPIKVLLQQPVLLSTSLVSLSHGIGGRGLVPSLFQPGRFCRYPDLSGRWRPKRRRPERVEKSSVAGMSPTWITFITTQLKNHIFETRKFTWIIHALRFCPDRGVEACSCIFILHRLCNDGQGKISMHLWWKQIKLKGNFIFFTKGALRFCTALRCKACAV